jgi:hypothetical protein
MPFFTQRSRADLRGVYVETWRKFRAKQPLAPLEAQISAVIAEHPEYHAWLEAEGAALGEEFTPERGAQNPFLHLGLHLAIRDQVATDRPRGIASIHGVLARRLGAAHEAEHRMLEVLAETLWEAHRSDAPPDEQRYLERLQRLAGSLKP